MQDICTSYISDDLTVNRMRIIFPWLNYKKEKRNYQGDCRVDDLSNYGEFLFKRRSHNAYLSELVEISTTIVIGFKN